MKDKYSTLEEEKGELDDKYEVLEEEFEIIKKREQMVKTNQQFFDSMNHADQDENSLKTYNRNESIKPNNDLDELNFSQTEQVQAKPEL
jgi:hypothetical protein